MPPLLATREALAAPITNTVGVLGKSGGATLAFACGCCWFPLTLVFLAPHSFLFAATAAEGAEEEAGPCCVAPSGATIGPSHGLTVRPAEIGLRGLRGAAVIDSTFCSGGTNPLPPNASVSSAAAPAAVGPTPRNCGEATRPADAAAGAGDNGDAEETVIVGAALAVNAASACCSRPRRLRLAEVRGGG